MRQRALLVMVSFVLVWSIVTISSCTATTPANEEASDPQTIPSGQTTGDPAAEITAETLISDALANPDKYSEGTVLRVSGVTTGKSWVNVRSSVEYIWLGPETEGWRVRLELGFDDDKETRLALKRLPVGTPVVVQGTYYHFDDNETQGGVILRECSPISPLE